MTEPSDSNDSRSDEMNRSDDSRSDDKKQLNVRISTELYKKLDSINESKGVVVTKALELYLSKDENNSAVSQEYVAALIKQLETKDLQIASMSRQLETKDSQIMERDNTTKMHIAQVQTLINQLESKQLELESAKSKKWYQFW
jgi:chromosome segregation ATPase